ncbi:MAG TPA: Hsp20/alpha crystallin family protein [Chlamydiales bacterium]|nr:Hsp20/alpha crystallin family protein [Chlamydiales bacterium]
MNIGKERKMLQNLNIERGLMSRNLPEPFLSRLHRAWDLFPNWDHEEETANQGLRIYEENNQLHVEAPMPGLRADDIDVSLNRGSLWIKGEATEEEKKKKMYRSATRKYSYSLVLPSQIDEKQEPQATYEDGILKVSLHLAKTAETKKIQIKSKKK